LTDFDLLGIEVRLNHCFENGVGHVFGTNYIWKLLAL
jgi:hypothetical protein